MGFYSGRCLAAYTSSAPSATHDAASMAYWKMVSGVSVSAASAM